MIFSIRQLLGKGLAAGRIAIKTVDDEANKYDSIKRYRLTIVRVHRQSDLRSERARPNGRTLVDVWVRWAAVRLVEMLA